MYSFHYFDFNFVCTYIFYRSLINFNSMYSIAFALLIYNAIIITLIYNKVMYENLLCI